MFAVKRTQVLISMFLMSHTCGRMNKTIRYLSSSPALRKSRADFQVSIHQWGSSWSFSSFFFLATKVWSAARRLREKFPTLNMLARPSPKLKFVLKPSSEIRFDINWSIKFRRSAPVIPFLKLNSLESQFLIACNLGCDINAPIMK